MGKNRPLNVQPGDHAIGKKIHGVARWDWRYGLGVTLLGVAALSIVFAIVSVLTGHAQDDSLGSPIWLLAGPAEILCLVAVAILGKDKYGKLARNIRPRNRQSASDTATSRLRYYLGLAGCLFNGVPLTLYAYVPEMMPGGLTKAGILVVADLVFFGSLLFAGGEFWEKFRRLFIWEGRV